MDYIDISVYSNQEVSVPKSKIFTEKINESNTEETIENNERVNIHDSDAENMDPKRNESLEHQTIFKENQRNPKSNLMNVLKEKIHKIVEDKFPSKISYFDMPKTLKQKENPKEILFISCQEIDFGNLIPGNILEKEVTIQNQSKKNLMINVLVICEDEELNELDEYVFSARKNCNFVYLEKLLLRISGHGSIKFTTALKVPNLKLGRDIKGKIIINYCEENKVIDTKIIKILSSVYIPKISCLREIYDVDNELSIIKYAIKKGKVNEIRVLFKNESNYTLDLGFEVLNTNKNDLVCFPIFTKAAANTIFGVNFYVHAKDKNIDEKFLNKIFIIKIKNSSLLYSFPLSLEFY